MPESVFTLIGFYETLFLALGNTVLMFFASFKFVQTLQQSGYEGRGYLTWLKRKDNIFMMRLVTVSLLSVLAFLIFNIATMLFVDSEWVIYIGFAFYVFFFVVYIKKDRVIKSKIPLVKTSRIKRLLLTFILVTFILNLLFLTLVNAGASFLHPDSLPYKLRYGMLCFAPMVMPVAVLLAYYVNEPFERYNKRLYIKKSKDKLATRPDLIKIGITGSYGKTSVKEILSVILSEKYSVLATPHSFNTPMGICKTVKLLRDNHEILITEMGARNIGDIKELVDIVKPSIAIMTGITGQHIETFGSVGNIKKTKNELIEGLPSDGYAVFATDNKNTAELFSACPINKTGAGVIFGENVSVWAENIVVTGKGTNFTLRIGRESVDCSTILIGTHNVSNICLAVAVAVKLGMTTESIASGINRIKPIKHRLEILESKGGTTIIDDTFNANVDGTIAAMEVLDCFSGRKVVVTPGLVELGSVEEHENFELGVRLGKHANLVVLVGKRRIERIKEGLIYSEFPKENIFVTKDLDEAKKLLASITKEGDVIFFENDLPDKYN